MNKIFHLSTCNTCQRILKEWQAEDAGIELQDVKKENISAAELDAAAAKTGSYESLFNRRAQKYRSLGLKDKNLSEQEYRQYILDEYTFMKRPLAIINGEVFAGNAKKTVEAAKNAIRS